MLRYPGVLATISIILLIPGLGLIGCVPNQIYHSEPADYLPELPVTAGKSSNCDLAIIEFDDQGQFWKIEQLEDTLALIERRNLEAQRGVLVIVFVHGWKNDANDQRGNLASFRENLLEIARRHAEGEAPKPDRVVGVYLAWRGATTRVPYIEQLTFWDRRIAAERMASHHMREALFRLMGTAKARPSSKAVVVGHSLGGLIVGQTFAHSLSALLMSTGEDGLTSAADLIVLINPARDALAAWQFVDFLKRIRADFQLRDADGNVVRDDLPMMVSITSEADRATRSIYPLGRGVANLASAFRGDEPDGLPDQRHLLTHTEGHVDALLSHRAAVVEGQVVFTEEPGRINDTPFWIVRVTAEICADHSDLENPNLGALLNQIYELNGTRNTNVRATLTAQPGRLSQ